MHASATSSPLAIALARHIVEHFPDLSGRAFAVTDTDDVWTAESAPALPLCAVGVVDEDYRDSDRGNGQEIVSTTIAILFAFKPDRYKTDDGRVSPFWAYFDHEKLRNRLWAALKAFRTPTGARVLLRRMEKDATEVAITFAFVAVSNEEWCAGEKIDAEVEARTLLTPAARIGLRSLTPTLGIPTCPDCEGMARNCPTCKERA